MVAGVRTQYENLCAVEPPPDFSIDTIPIIPYKSGGIIERLPMLRSTQKGTLRSTTHALPLIRRPDYDTIWTQALLPLLPLLVACDGGLKAHPGIIYTIDTTPALMDSFTRAYRGAPPAGPAKRALRDALYRYALRHCAAITPWSEWAAQSFLRDYGVPEQRIRIIPPGVDLATWSVPARRHVHLGQEDAEPFRLLFVGADFERKGGPLLLDIFRQSLRETCEVHLVTRANVPQESGVWVYRGFGPNEPGLRSLYERCDALVLPTRADCFSMAAIEAMACGLPVITCPVGGIPEIVQHAETGFLVPPDDGCALLEAIQALVSERTRAARMGLAGRRVVEKRFDNSRNSAALFTLMGHAGRQACAGRRMPRGTLSRYPDNNRSLPKTEGVSAYTSADQRHA
jgi:glycosyltransferase involved in cell wall biosynthesis